MLDSQHTPHGSQPPAHIAATQNVTDIQPLRLTCLQSLCGRVPPSACKCTHKEGLNLRALSQPSLYLEDYKSGRRTGSLYNGCRASKNRRGFLTANADLMTWVGTGGDHIHVGLERQRSERDVGLSWKPSCWGCLTQAKLRGSHVSKPAVFVLAVQACWQ